MAQVAGRWRGQVKQRLASIGERRRFWEKTFGGRFATLVANGQTAQASGSLSRICKASPQAMKARRVR